MEKCRSFDCAIRAPLRMTIVGLQRRVRLLAHEAHPLRTLDCEWLEFTWVRKEWGTQDPNLTSLEWGTRTRRVSYAGSATWR
jgi:hypothetical protein